MQALVVAHDVAGADPSVAAARVAAEPAMMDADAAVMTTMPATAASFISNAPFRPEPMIRVWSDDNTPCVQAASNVASHYVKPRHREGSCQSLNNMSLYIQPPT